jgi:hypothetical protein
MSDKYSHCVELFSNFDRGGRKIKERYCRILQSILKKNGLESRGVYGISALNRLAADIVELLAEKDTFIKKYLS